MEIKYEFWILAYIMEVYGDPLYCVHLGYLDSVKLLVERQVEVNCLDQSGETPIQKASRHGHNPVVVFLLANGADVNTPNNVGMYSSTPSHLPISIYFRCS